MLEFHQLQIKVLNAFFFINRRLVGFMWYKKKSTDWSEQAISYIANGSLLTLINDFFM